MKIVPTYVYIYTCGHNGMIKFVCGHNGTADTTGRTSRSVLSACGHNGTIKFVCGHNGTADTTGRTSRSVLSACGHNGTIKFVCGHNGTADTTGRNRRDTAMTKIPFLSKSQSVIVSPNRAYCRLQHWGIVNTGERERERELLINPTSLIALTLSGYSWLL